MNLQQHQANCQANIDAYIESILVYGANFKVKGTYGIAEWEANYEFSCGNPQYYITYTITNRDKINDGEYCDVTEWQLEGLITENLKDWDGPDGYEVVQQAPNGDCGFPKKLTDAISNYLADNNDTDFVKILEAMK